MDGKVINVNRKKVISNLLAHTPGLAAGSSLFLRGFMIRTLEKERGGGGGGAQMRGTCLTTVRSGLSQSE